MTLALAKSLSRLSRTSLIELCLQWSQSQHSNPYLASNRNLLESDEEDYLHEPAKDVQDLRRIYEDLRLSFTTKDQVSKQDIIDRIVDGDWRRGLSLHQLATIDFACLEQNDAAFRWTALRLVPLIKPEGEAIHPAKRRKVSTERSDQPLYPQITPTVFLANLKAQISPLVKAHYTLHRLKSGPNLTILRLYIVPNEVFDPKKSLIPKTPKDSIDFGRVVYIAVPDSCPYVYVSVSGNSGTLTASKTRILSSTKVDIATTKRLIFEAIPKAFSRPQERWAMQSTKLTTKSLKALCLLRGNGRQGTAGGAFSQFSDGYENQNFSKEDTWSSDRKAGITLSRPFDQPTPTCIQLPTPPPEKISELEMNVFKRFGSISGAMLASLNRFHVQICNITSPPPSALSKSSEQTHGRGRKRKRLSLEEIENGVQQIAQDGSEVSEQRNNDLEPSGLSLSFSGTDVFAGLRQLALLGPEYIDLGKMPAWVTGEKGVSALVV
jgi:central kinetochore subunit Mis15/CHL4